MHFSAREKLLTFSCLVRRVNYSHSTSHTIIFSVCSRLTIHKQLKDLSHIGCYSIPIGGYTGVGIRVFVPGVAESQTTTDIGDISTSGWNSLWIREIAETDV